MRILYWASGFWPAIGGVESITTPFLREIAAHGNECAVFAPQGIGTPPAEDLDGIRIRRFPFWEALSLGNVRLFHETVDRVEREQESFSPEVVHVGCIDIGSIFERLASRDSRRPLLATIQQAQHLRTFHAFESVIRKTLRAADWITCCSEAVRTEFAELVGPDKRISIIQNALPKPSAEPTSLPWEPPVVLCIGRLVEDKGFDLALRAFADIGDSMNLARMRIVGDGPDRDRLEALAKALGIADRVDFDGAIPHHQVWKRFSAATLVVVPSRREAFGLVALEAAQMARPVIATAAGGLPEVVIHGETGTVVPVDDVQGLGSAITSLLSNRHEAVRMGLAARKRASDFGWDRYVSSYETIYEQLVRGESSQITHGDGIQEENDVETDRNVSRGTR